MTLSTSEVRSLLLQRLSEIVGAPSEFVQQPRILDGDHCLGGKGGDEVNLLVGERPHVGAGEPQHAYWDALAQHGISEH
jgi:hypothetical protein